MYMYTYTDLSIDAMDVSGEHQLDVLHSIYKQRLTPEGQAINEQPEEIKLGTEHEEGGDGEDNDCGRDRQVHLSLSGELCLGAAVTLYV